MVQSISRPYFDPVLSGKKMRSIRKSRNISVEQVREYMGFESVQSIYKWERGECFPQADTLIALSMLYRVNPVELFEEDAEASSFHLFMKLYRSTVGPVLSLLTIARIQKNPKTAPASAAPVPSAAYRRKNPPNILSFTKGQHSSAITPPYINAVNAASVPITKRIHTIIFLILPLLLSICSPLSAQHFKCGLNGSHHVLEFH